MASKLAATFLRCALGPINYAGGCIISSRVPDGLRELAIDNLHGGVKRGIEAAAKQVGVGVADVERLLPMWDINATAGRLDLAQRGAVDAWGMHAGQIGGLLAGVAELTVDGRSPDVSMFLERLAKKVARDKPLSVPLQALSVEVAHWMDLVEQCGDLLADGGVLAEAYRRRMLKRVAAAIGALAIVGVGVFFLMRQRSLRARVEAGLAGADPCAALAIDAGDLERASADQQARAKQQRTTCEEGRKRAEQAREEQRRRDEAVREKERVRKEREAKCTALADHVGAGDLRAEDEALAGDRAALLRRIARKSLEVSDLAATGELPCAGSPAGDKLGQSLEAAVLAAPMLWARAADISPAVQAILVKHVDELPSVAKQVLGEQADEAARRVMLMGDASYRTRAVKLCGLKTALRVGGGKYCSGVDKR